MCSNLGMCKRCGDLKMIACSKCRGLGVIRGGGLFGFALIEDVFQSHGQGRTTTKSVPCLQCRAKGRLKCPVCSNIWKWFPLDGIGWNYFRGLFLLVTVSLASTTSLRKACRALFLNFYEEYNVLKLLSRNVGIR